MNAKTNPPFDPRAVTFKEETKTFEESVFHFISLEDRKRWMQAEMLDDLHVFQVGYFKKAHGHVVERRNLDEGILIYCVGGKGQYTQDGTTWPVLSGDLIYITPKTHHRYEADKKDPWTIHWMHLSGARMTMYRKLIGFSPETPVTKLGVHIEVIDLFRSLYSLYAPIIDRAHYASIYACAQHILAAVALAKRPSNNRPQWEQEIQEVMSFMEKSVDKKMRLDDFSEYLGLSRFHFSRRFKTMVGVSPMRYFMQLKMKKACFLLESSALKVKAISQHLGFDSEYYFSRCFKTCVGCSPQNYCKDS